MNRNDRNPSPNDVSEAVRGEEEHEVSAGKEDLENPLHSEADEMASAQEDPPEPVSAD